MIRHGFFPVKRDYYYYFLSSQNLASVAKVLNIQRFSKNVFAL